MVKECSLSPGLCFFPCLSCQPGRTRQCCSCTSPLLLVALRFLLPLPKNLPTPPGGGAAVLTSLAPPVRPISYHSGSCLTPARAPRVQEGVIGTASFLGWDLVLSDKVLQEIIAQVGAVGQRLRWRLRARVLGHCVLLCQFSTTGVCQLLISFLIAFPWLKAQGYQEPEGALKGPLLPHPTQEAVAYCLICLQRLHSTCHYC